LSSDIEWKTVHNEGISYEFADMGPFRALLIKAATTDLNLNFAWQVLDMRNNKQLFGSVARVSHIMTLVQPSLEPTTVADCKLKAMEYLNKTYEDYMIEQIVLGGNSE